MPVLCYAKGSPMDPSVYFGKHRTSTIFLYHAHVWPGIVARRRNPIEKRLASFLRAASRQYYQALYSGKTEPLGFSTIPAVLLHRGIWLAIGETPLPRSTVRLRNREPDLTGTSLDTRQRLHQTLRNRTCRLCGTLHNEEILLASKTLGWSCIRILTYVSEARSRAWSIAARGGHSPSAQKEANRSFHRDYPFTKQSGESLGAWHTRIAALKREDLPSWPVSSERTLPPGRHQRARIT